MDPKQAEAKNLPTILDGKYILKDKIGNGSFGQIYIAFCKDNASSVAIKLEKRSSGSIPILGKEAKILSELRGEKGFPKIYHFGREPTFNYMAIDLLGHDLQRLYKNCNYKFSMKTILMVMDQMLTRIESLHNKGYLHRDIKPENFCISKDMHGELCLIDFGLSRSYKDLSGKHIECVDKKGLVGTARYASINSHKGLEQSRRDDLEAIGYAIVYLVKGRLPWQDLKAIDRREKYEMIGNVKEATPLSILCKDIPEEFATYLEYVRKLEFAAEPDYKYLKGLFRSLFLRSGYEFDSAYDWLSSKQKEELRSINQNARDYSKGNNQQRGTSVASSNDINELPTSNSKDKGIIAAPYTKRYRGSIVSFVKEPEISSYRFLLNGETLNSKQGWKSPKFSEVEAQWRKNDPFSERKTSMEKEENEGKMGIIFSDNSNRVSSATSIQSSKAPNVSKSKYEEDEDEIPKELQVKTSAIKATKPTHTKNRDSFTFSSQAFDLLQPQSARNYGGGGGDELRAKLFARPQSTMLVDEMKQKERNSKVQAPFRGRFASGGEEAIVTHQSKYQEENLNESSICERVETNKTNIIGQRRFTVHGSKIF